MPARKFRWLLEQVGGVAGAENRRVGWQRVMCRLACGSMCGWDKIWAAVQNHEGPRSEIEGAKDRGRCLELLRADLKRDKTGGRGHSRIRLTVGARRRECPVWRDGRRNVPKRV